MSKSLDMIDAQKQNNPVYGILSDQIKTENKLFLAKSDNFNAYLTLLCKTCFTGKEYKTLVNDYIKSVELKLKGKANLSILKEVALAEYLSRETNKESKAIKEYVHRYEDNFAQSQLSNNTKGLVLFLLKESLDNYDKVSQQINSKAENFIKAGNIVGAIDLMIGVKKPSNMVTEVFSSIDKTSNLNTERLGKLIIILNNTSTEPGRYVRDLEKKLYNGAAQWRTPDITLSLFEAYKLINSNIPEEHINVILENLKKVNTNWAKIVNKIEKEGVVVNMEGLKRIPDFSPNDDVWALKALEATNRSYTYQLTEDAYQEYSTLKSQEEPGFQKVKSRALMTILLLVTVLTLINYFLVDKYGWGIKETLELQLPSNAASIDELLKIGGTILINPTVSILLSLLWIILLYQKSLLKTGRLTIQDLVLNFPPVAWIVRKR